MYDHRRADCEDSAMNCKKMQFILIGKLDNVSIKFLVCIISEKKLTNLNRTLGFYFLKNLKNLNLKNIGFLGFLKKKPKKTYVF